MYFCERESDGCLRLKLYQSEGSLPLSEGVPALEDFGFYVRSEMPTVLDDGRLGTIHDFLLDLKPGSDPKALVERAGAIEEALAAVLNGEAENDPFNRLVPEAGLAAREANWLRAFYRYLRQAGMGFTIYTVVDALAAAPDVTRALIALFTARHDPEFGNGRDKAIEEARAAIKRGLAKVKAINDDRLLRLYNS
ncbi:MAG: glutamate dehydrogenase, partial [Pseudomonadota bacterium]|nr:glutamate dehydrogenase [Pseudomonadota bacterium]